MKFLLRLIVGRPMYNWIVQAVGARATYRMAPRLPDTLAAEILYDDFVKASKREEA